MKLRLALAALTTLPVLTVSSPSQAATTDGYPSALAQVGASTRSEPYLYDSDGQTTYWGQVLRDPDSYSDKQTVSVMCWYDGDSATGNYTSDRWFKVLVYEDYDGYNTPRWLFVHASYVYNQPVVRMCEASNTGYW